MLLGGGSGLPLASFGGSGGTSLVTPAMRRLPIGVPKVMVSTMASGNVSQYVGTSDIGRRGQFLLFYPRVGRQLSGYSLDSLLPIGVE